jgi:pimeloyl-ACP methyl ester carboxylesterase
MLFHYGTPGVRLLSPQAVGAAVRCGVRLLVPDRPGYGGSSRRPGRRVADVVEDIVQLADALGWDRFATWGGSGGAPHALACAALLPDRVRRCASVVGPAPFDADRLDWFAGMSAGNVEEFTRALGGGSLPALAMTRSWGFPLARIEVPVSVWYGSADVLSLAGMPSGSSPIFPALSAASCRPAGICWATRISTASTPGSPPRTPDLGAAARSSADANGRGPLGRSAARQAVETRRHELRFRVVTDDVQDMGPPRPDFLIERIAGARHAPRRLVVPTRLLWRGRTPATAANPAPRRGPTERAPAGPDRVQVANLQLTSDQAVHVTALRRRGGGNLHRHGAARHRPRRCASAGGRRWFRSGKVPARPRRSGRPHSTNGRSSVL